MITIGILIIWVACGILDAAAWRAMLRNKWPALSRDPEQCRSDANFSLVHIPAGPFGLLASVFIPGCFQYGFENPLSPKSWEPTP